MRIKKTVCLSDLRWFTLSPIVMVLYNWRYTHLSLNHDYGRYGRKGRVGVQSYFQQMFFLRKDFKLQSKEQKSVQRLALRWEIPLFWGMVVSLHPENSHVKTNKSATNRRELLLPAICLKPIVFFTMDDSPGCIPTNFCSCVVFVHRNWWNCIYTPQV